MTASAVYFSSFFMLTLIRSMDLASVAISFPAHGASTFSDSFPINISSAVRVSPTTGLMTFRVSPPYRNSAQTMGSILQEFIPRSTPTIL